MQSQTGNTGILLNLLPSLSGTTARSLPEPQSKTPPSIPPVRYPCLYQIKAMKVHQLEACMNFSFCSYWSPGSNSTARRRISGNALEIISILGLQIFQLRKVVIPHFPIHPPNRKTIENVFSPVSSNWIFFLLTLNIKILEILGGVWATWQQNKSRTFPTKMQSLFKTSI